MLDIQGRKYASVTVCNVTLRDIITDYPIMYFDTLKVTNIDGTAEVTDIMGGQGNPILASISHSKAMAVNFDDAIMTMSSLAVLTGGSLASGTDTDTIKMSESEIVGLTTASTSVTLTREAKTGTYVYIAQLIDGQLSTVSRTEAKLVADADSVLLSAFHNFEYSGTDDANFRVFYEYEIGFPTSTESISELTILAERFAGTYKFIGDTLLFNQYSGSNDIFQIEIPKLKLDSVFNISLSAATEAVVFSFAGKALRDDLGRMMMFRQIENIGGATGEDGQFDGSNDQIPAVEVTVDSATGALTDTGTVVPVPPTPSV